MLNVTITSFQYPTSNKEILSNVNFKLEQGKQLAILGESGCGKSTLLHLIFGLLNLDNGEIYYGKQQLFGPSHNLIPGHDFMKLVSQDLDLMPFTSVAENVGEHLSRIDTSEDTKKIDEVLSVVGLLPFKNRKVNTLSGGQKQRVALAKALANEPKVLLLDEPFSSIDAFLKNKLRRELYRYLQQHQITCIIATHDADEALAFSDRLLVLKEGQILQIGPPENVYAAATSVYEKGFYGEVSIIPAGILAENELNLLPQELKISEEQTPLEVTVTASYFKGRSYLIVCKWNAITLFFEHSEKIQNGSQVYLSLAKAN